MPRKQKKALKKPKGGRESSISEYGAGRKTTGDKAARRPKARQGAVTVKSHSQETRGSAKQYLADVDSEKAGLVPKAHSPFQLNEKIGHIQGMFPNTPKSNVQLNLAVRRNLSDGRAHSCRTDNS